MPPTFRSAIEDDPAGAAARPKGDPRLPADLAKLRERFLQDHPEALARVDRLASVPAALRHLLALRLELDRADALPRRYRDLAETVLDRAPGPAGQSPPAVDAVDALVIFYATHVRAGSLDEAAALLPQLRRFFTQGQIVELALALALARGLALFDALLDG